MTSVAPFNWRAERTAELSEACREAFEAQVNYERIATEWSAEIADTHPEIHDSAREKRLQPALCAVLLSLYDTDAVAQLGATLGACMTEDEFGAKWWADYREEQRCREAGDDGSGY